MAALLRSARLLKISPSPLLRLTGGHRHAATAGAVYSRAACRRAAGSSGALGSLSPYSSASVCSTLRYYGTASEQKGEVTEEPSIGIRNKQADNFDWALSKLDNSVRRTGRITKTLLQKIFQDICRKGYPSGNQALLLLRSCGSLLPEVPLQERTEFAHHIWEKLQALGVTYDVSHHNALLKVYLQNEFKFSPTDFLAKMEAANVQPNRVTYQRLISAYCQDGDIEGASKILAFMKSKDLPITEAVFNSLVTGHSRAGDLESAANILSVMRGAGIEPGADTYVTLLSAYAENGDIAKIKETMETLQNMGTSLIDRELMQVVFSLAKAGHQQHVPELLGQIRHDVGYVPEAMNLCLSLITLVMEDTAFAVLKTFPVLQTESPIDDSLSLGNFFLRHCVNMNKSVEKLVFFCNSLKDDNFHSSPLQFTLHCALDSKNTAMAVGLMKIMKKDGLPVRPHYFWPLLIQHQKDKNTAGTVEVLKAMQELDVVPDIDTYSIYVLGNFPSLDKAQAALEEAGCDVHTSDFVSAVVRFEAVKKNLSELFSLMSNPSFPVIELSSFRASLISGFLGSSDVESMAKITELLFKDSRYVKEGTENTDNVAYFLYNLFKAMDEEKMSEKKLIKYLEELKKRDITIPENIYRGITKILKSYNMSALNEHVYALVDKQTVTAAPDTPVLNDLTENVLDLEKKLKEYLFQGRPADITFKRLIKVLCDQENLSRALELKTQHEDLMSIGCYVFLIKLCNRLDNLDVAMKLKKELDLKGFEAPLEDNIYMNLVAMLSKNNRLDEAEDLLKEMKEKNVSLRSITLLFHTLNEHGLKGDTTTIRRLQDTMFTLGLVNPSSNLCTPLITSYLEREDLPGALDAVIECNKLYRQLPRLHQIICALIEKGDTELLQKAMDFVSKERGEMMMMYELLFGFLWTGRYKEARKIAETPGLRSKPGRLQWFAEKCITANKMETLESMVDMTAKLFECDRDEMYHYVLRLCKKTNNWQKAEAVWMKMQEENIIPREKTLLLLADILKSNKQNVPFEVPEVWYEQPEAKEESSKVEGSPTLSDSPLYEASPDDYQHQVQKLCKKGNAMDALNILKEAESKNITLSSASFDILIRALLAQGNMEDALAVKDIAVSHVPEFQLSDKAASLLIVTQAKSGKVEDALAGLNAMIQAEKVPLQLAIRQVVQGLARQGDIKGIQDVQNTVGALFQSMNMSSTSFMNSTAMAHIKNGDLDSAVEILESVYTQEKLQNASSVFRAVIEANNEKALDKLSAMAERLCNHLALYRPATDLFIQYLDLGKTEEAKFLLQRCAAVAEQRTALTSYMSKSSSNPGKAANIKNLMELVPDFIDQNTFCCYLMKCYVTDKDLSSAKALYQQLQNDGIQVDELSLKRLAKLYTDAGETVPFEEPPESFKYYADKLKTSQAQRAEEN